MELDDLVGRRYVGSLASQKPNGFVCPSLTRRGKMTLVEWPTGFLCEPILGLGPYNLFIKW